MKKLADSVILVSSGFTHPGPGERRALKVLLPPTIRVASLDLLPAFLDGGPRGIVLYYHRKNVRRADPRVLDALEAYLRDGGRILALHAATASYKQDDRYKALVGGRFRGHGPVEEFPVEPVTEWARELTTGFSVRDELYRHDLTDDLEVHLRSNDAALAWSRYPGTGELLYLAFGHERQVFLNEGVRGVIQGACRRLFGADT